MLEVIKFEPQVNSDWLVYRYPDDDYTSRSKLIVGPGQRALCVHLGQIEGEFKPGVTVLSTENYPFLSRFVSAVNGGNPYPVQIYFVNTTVNTKTNWATLNPAYVADPESGIPVHIRAFGSYIFRLRDPQFLLQMVLGNMESGSLVSFTWMKDQFDDKVQEAVQENLNSLIIDDKVPALGIASQTARFSKKVLAGIDDFFRKYGFEITDFNTASINIPEEDLQALKKRREFDVLGTSHVTERQLDIAESWSKNEGTAGGVAVGMMGIGMGFNAMGGMTPYPNQGNYPYPNNQGYPQQGGNPQGYAQGGAVAGGAAAGMNAANGAQNHDTVQSFKFCPKCGNKVSMDAMFCSKCGTKLGE